MKSINSPDNLYLDEQDQTAAMLAGLQPSLLNRWALPEASPTIQRYPSQIFPINSFAEDQQNFTTSMDELILFEENSNNFPIQPFPLQMFPINSISPHNEFLGEEEQRNFTPSIGELIPFVENSNNFPIQPFPLQIFPINSISPHNGFLDEEDPRNLTTSVDTSIPFEGNSNNLPAGRPTIQPFPFYIVPINSISPRNEFLGEEDQQNFTTSFSESVPFEGSSNSTSAAGPVNLHIVKERQKTLFWTEEEHRDFLRGMELYGKGHWTIISREIVKTKSPAQVASHAQKFFLRQNVIPSNRKRSSIHDITTTTTDVNPKSNEQLPIELRAFHLEEKPQSLFASTVAPVNSEAFPTSWSAPALSLWDQANDNSGEDPAAFWAWALEYSRSMY